MAEITTPDRPTRLEDGVAAFGDDDPWRITYEARDGTLLVTAVDGDPGPWAVHRGLDVLLARHQAEAIRVPADRSDRVPIHRPHWERDDDGYRIPRPRFQQVREPWLAPELWPVAPGTSVEADCPGGEHPYRPRVPDGRLYRKHLTATGGVLELHRAQVDEHGALFHRWQNKPYVAEAWDEAGTRQEHDAYLQEKRRDPHIDPVVGTLDGTPFLYLEVYWALEDRVGPHYDAGPYDQGLHLLVGEKDYLGGELTSAWLRAACHFLFLRDPRTRRIVGEPDAGNDRVIHRLRDVGWTKRKTFDFPHKHAALLTCERDAFFRGQHP